MKEYTANTGGRYCYNEDVLNLQDLALAHSAIFEEFGDFIVAGCELNGTTITPGIIWLNGKLRKFEGADNIDYFPRYLCEHNSTETVEYANDTTQNGRIVYGCVLTDTIPTHQDSLTGEVPHYIEFKENYEDTPRTKSVFFGRHCLLLESRTGTQTVKDAIVFKKSVKINGTIEAESRLLVKNIINIGDDRLYIQQGPDKMLIIGNNNSASEIRIIATNSAVNLIPNIKENGILLSDKYAQKNAGFTQFIVGNTTAATLRQQIDALSQSDMDAKYAQLDKCLSDMAPSDSIREKIRHNIDAQQQIKDTGWLQATQDPSLGIINTDIYVRQYGPFVYIQGKAKPFLTGEIWFALPSLVKPPKYDVSFYLNYGVEGDVHAIIDKNQYLCRIAACTPELRNREVNINITYMV